MFEMTFPTWMLRGLAALGLPLLLAAQPTQAPGLAATLRTARWQQRLLLLGAPTAAQTRLLRQRQLLATPERGLAERDITVLEVAYDQLAPADRQCWTQQLGQPLAGFRVVLVGKDGGVKRASPRALPPAELFGTVDKMPMRRQEMRSRSGASPRPASAPL